jgi:hypothetical protein
VVSAPPDHWLAAALAADFDADGAERIVAWVAPDRGRDGALWLFPAAGAAREVWRLPTFVPTARTARSTPSSPAPAPRR